LLKPDENGVASPSSGKGGFFYWWVVVAASVLISTVVFGIRYSFGVFFTSLEADFGWDRATTSGLYSVYLLLASVMAVLGGWTLDRYGPRMLVVIMGLVTGLSLFLTGRADSIWQLYLAYSVLLALGTGATYTIVMSTGSRWFLAKRGTALGIIGAGGGLGTILMIPVAAYLVSAYDWRTSYFVMALLAWAFIPVSALFLKKEPQEIGALPDGRAHLGMTKASPQVQGKPRQFSLADALRTRSYWLFFFTWLIYSYNLHLVVSHLVPRAEDVGVPTVQAAFVVSLLGGVSVPARIFMGRVSDRIAKRQIGIVLALLHTAALLWLVGSTQLWMFYLFAIVYGFAYGAIDPPLTALLGEIFGLRNLGVIMGTVNVGWGLGAALGPYLTGLIFDITGSYSMAFLIGGLAWLLAAAFIFGLRAPAAKNVYEG
jgi:MFS family permease